MVTSTARAVLYGQQCLLPEEAQPARQGNRPHGTLLAGWYDEAELRAVDRELYLVAVLQVPLRGDGSSVEQSGVCLGYLHELPHVTVPDDGGMVARDGDETLVEAHLTVRVAAQLYVVYDYLLCLPCAVILARYLVLKDIVAAAARAEHSPHAGLYGAGERLPVWFVCFVHRDERLVCRQ